MFQNLSRLQFLRNYNMLANNLFSASQSAYRPIHSTKTSLLRVTKEIFLNMENQRVTLLLPLDLRTAFDTVDLLSCIGSSFHLISKEKFSLGLSHIFRQVFINDILSDVTCLSRSVPSTHAHTPVRTCTAEIWKNYILFISSHFSHDIVVYIP